MYGICDWCGRQLEVEPSPLEMIHFCSQKCYDEYFKMLKKVEGGEGNGG
jgi:hypothetical protein